jgi:hypothetical protein
MTARFTVRPLGTSDCAGVASLHAALFGSVEGLSIARFGETFLDKVFYRLNLDNPAFHCDVAEDRGAIVGFSVWTTDRSGVFRHLLYRKPLAAALGTIGALFRRPSLIVALAANVRYLFGERLPPHVEANGWWLVAGVRPECRTREWEAEAGGQVASALFDAMESAMVRLACDGWIGVVHADNTAINRFLTRRGAAPVHRARAQGQEMVFYRKALGTGG